ncbi:hypothetical protein P7K49_029872, partial [Saguinus oedipus]
ARLPRHRLPTKKHSVSFNKSSVDMVALVSIEMRGFRHWKEPRQLDPKSSTQPTE